MEIVTDKEKLKQRSKHVDEVTPDIIKYGYEVAEFMYKSKGVGMACIQVGNPVRMFVMSPNFQPSDTRIIINPVINNHGTEIVVKPEGCLSFPGIIQDVPRFAVIDVQYIDNHGKLVKKTLKRWEARIFQHEFDHLEGICKVGEKNGKTKS